MVEREKGGQQWFFFLQGGYRFEGGVFFFLFWDLSMRQSCERERERERERYKLEENWKRDLDVERERERESVRNRYF